MIGLYIVLGIVLLFAILLITPQSAFIVADNDHLSIFAKVFFIKIPIYPQEKNPKKLLKKEKKKSSSKKEKKKTDKDVENTKKIKKKDILSLIRWIARLLAHINKSFPRYFKLTLSEIHIEVGTPDAAQTAITYAVITNALVGLTDILDNFLTIKTPNVKKIVVSPNFLLEDTNYRFNIHLSTSLGKVISLLWKVFLFYRKDKKLRSPKNGRVKTK